MLVANRTLCRVREEDINEDGTFTKWEDINSINMYCFKNNKALKKIDIPASITYIERNAFEGCEALEEVYIDDGVSEIELEAFRDCKSLRKITLPNSIKTINDCLFENCISLKEIHISDGVESIGFDAFANCKSLEKVSMPNSVTLIERGAFRNCIALKDINISCSVDWIADDTFLNCKSLEKIEIPNTVEVTCTGFFACESLQEIKYNGEIKKVKCVNGYSMETISKYKIGDFDVIKHKLFNFDFYYFTVTKRGYSASDSDLKCAMDEVTRKINKDRGMDGAFALISDEEYEEIISGKLLSRLYI